MSDSAIEGIDEAGIASWFATQIPGVVPPLRYELIAGGHSNLTFKVQDETDNVYVLRRPPLGQVLATAHDMEREHRVVSAVAKLRLQSQRLLVFAKMLRSTALLSM